MRYTISKSRQAKNHFMATKNVYIENPYDSITYHLRGRKIIILPVSTGNFPTYKIKVVYEIIVVYGKYKKGEFTQLKFYRGIVST